MYKRSAHINTHTPQHPGQEWWGAPVTQAQAHTPTTQNPARSGGVQVEGAHKHTPTPTPQPRVAGRSRNPSASTHTDTTHPSQECRGTSRARTQTQTAPNTTARTHTHHNPPAMSGGAQSEPEPKRTHPRRTAQPGVAGYKGSAHTNTHTPQHPSHDWRSTAETQAQTHTPTPHTPAKSGGVLAERAQKHTHAAHPSKEWQGTSRARTQTHTHPNTPTRTGGVQAERGDKHTQPQTPEPQVVGRSRSQSPNKHTNAAQPSQEWRGTSGARTQPRIHPSPPARSGGAQPKPEPKHTHQRRTPQPGVAGYKRSAHTNTHTTQHPSQEWRGTSGAHTQTHTQPNIPARSGGAQPQPEPKHTHPRRTPQPGVAGYKRSAHTNTHIPQHPSHGWRGAAKSKARTQTPTPQTQARNGGELAERAHKPTHSRTP